MVPMSSTSINFKSYHHGTLTPALPETWPFDWLTKRSWTASQGRRPPWKAYPGRRPLGTPHRSCWKEPRSPKDCGPCVPTKSWPWSWGENGGEALLHGFPNRMELVTLDPSQAHKNVLYNCHLQSPISLPAELHKCQSLQRESQSLQERRPPRCRPGRLRPVLLLSATGIEVQNSLFL